MKNTSLFILASLFITQAALAEGRPHFSGQSHVHTGKTGGIKSPISGPLVKYEMNTKDIGIMRQENIIQIKKLAEPVVEPVLVKEPLLVKTVESGVIAEPVLIQEEVKVLEAQPVELQKVQRSTASRLLIAE
jgi:hypothetical protein